MLKGGKLTKLKCMIKKWQTNAKNGRTDRTSISANPCDDTWQMESVTGDDKISGGLQEVYVGKSRRRYLISAEVIDHPLFKVLIEKSGESDAMTVGCEVVLFEHLLWMLQNADPQPESLDELVEFYAC